jgi:hypothetical protein
MVMTSGALKGQGFLEQLSDCQFVMIISDPWSWMMMVISAFHFTQSSWVQIRLRAMNF